METLKENLERLEIANKFGEDYRILKAILEIKKTIKIGELEKITKGIINPVELSVMINFACMSEIVNLFYLDKKEKKKPAKRYYYSQTGSEHILVKYTGGRHLKKILERRIEKKYIELGETPPNNL